jgi:hypothetical protein
MSPSSSTTAPFRRRFVEFIQALYEFLGHAAPSIDKADDDDLAVELQIDEIRFFVGHSPDHPSRLTAYACVGKLPEENALSICRQLLALNMQLAWNSPATLGLNEDTAEIFYMFKASIESIEPRSFLGNLQSVAQEVQAWIDENLENPNGASSEPQHALLLGLTRV